MSTYIISFPKKALKKNIDYIWYVTRGKITSHRARERANTMNRGSKMANNLDKPSTLKPRLHHSELGSASRIWQILSISSCSASAECSEVKADVFLRCSSLLASGEAIVGASKRALAAPASADGTRAPDTRLVLLDCSFEPLTTSTDCFGCTPWICEGKIDSLHPHNESPCDVYKRVTTSESIGGQVREPTQQDAFI